MSAGAEPLLQRFVNDQASMISQILSRSEAALKVATLSDRIMCERTKSVRQTNNPGTGQTRTRSLTKPYINVGLDVASGFLVSMPLSRASNVADRYALTPT